MFLCKTWKNIYCGCLIFFRHACISINVYKHSGRKGCKISRGKKGRVKITYDFLLWKWKLYHYVLCHSQSRFWSTIRCGMMRIVTLLTVWCRFMYRHKEDDSWSQNIVENIKLKRNIDMHKLFRLPLRTSLEDRQTKAKTLFPW